jgi:hypothetical protein
MAVRSRVMHLTAHTGLPNWVDMTPEDGSSHEPLIGMWKFSLISLYSNDALVGVDFTHTCHSRFGTADGISASQP